MDNSSTRQVEIGVHNPTCSASLGWGWGEFNSQSKGQRGVGGGKEELSLGLEHGGASEAPLGNTGLGTPFENPCQSELSMTTNCS